MIRIKTGFRISNPDWNPDFRLWSGLNPVFGFQIRIKTGFRISDPDWNPDFRFRSGFNPDSGFQIRIKTGFRNSDPDWNPDFRFRSGFNPDFGLTSGFGLNRIWINFWPHKYLKKRFWTILTCNFEWSATKIKIKKKLNVQFLNFYHFFQFFKSLNGYSMKKFLKKIQKKVYHLLRWSKMSQIIFLSKSDL